MSGDDDAQPAPLAEFRLTRSVTIQWAVISTVGFFVFAYAFGVLLMTVQGESLEPIVVSASSPPDVLVGFLALFGVVVLVVIPHELIHGVFMARYGGTPEYGVGVSYFILPYAYAKTEGAWYTRNQLLIVLLAPLVIISVVGFALAVLSLVPVSLVAIALAANAAGSIGDLWMAALLIRYPPSVRVGEHPDGETQGIAIYGSTETATRAVPGGDVLPAFVAGTIGTFTALSVGIVALVFLSLTFATGNVVLGNPDSSLFLFRHELLSESHGAVIEVGLPLLLALSALGGLVWTLVSRSLNDDR